MDSVTPDNPGIWQISANFGRVTVISDRHGLVLFDAGGRWSLPRIKRGLASRGRSLADVKLIVVSHWHPDHAGGVTELAAATGAPVAVHEAELAILERLPKVPGPFYLRPLDVVARQIMPIMYGRSLPRIITLTDGKPLETREDIVAVHTPGHTPGSICLYLPHTGTLVVADSLQYRFRTLSRPAWLVTKDHSEAGRSIAKLARLGARTILFSHFPPLQAEAGKLLSQLAVKCAVP
ncbi:MAG: MBL fold metallo-hydrolase [Chloroflexi bacterium]|nr:MBL fold metallo-hydrolase [Chloroflexota bacterium]